MSTALDNAVWHALGTSHAAMAEVVGTARRYQPDISFFSGVEALDDNGWADLARLVGAGNSTVVFRREVPPLPASWRVERAITGGQFVADTLRPPDLAAAPQVVALGAADVDRMVELTSLARPGPFTRRTHELGEYVGVEQDGVLIAMAGERFRLPGYTEVSAVCTRAEARGRGLAAFLTYYVASRIQERGDTPFLHVAEGNDSARRVYERLGFTLRTPVQFNAITALEEP